MLTKQIDMRITGIPGRLEARTYNLHFSDYEYCMGGDHENHITQSFRPQILIFLFLKEWSKWIQDLELKTHEFSVQFAQSLHVGRGRARCQDSRQDHALCQYHAMPLSNCLNA